MGVSATTPRAVVRGIEDVRALKDEIVGPSAWREVTQDMINQFAELTGDHQWIHVDVERARRESPFGTTVAHGNLTLSLIDGMRLELIKSSGFKLGVNYGWNKVRFPAPVPLRLRKIRTTAEVVEVEEVGGGWWQVVTRFDCGGRRLREARLCGRLRRPRARRRLTATRSCRRPPQRTRAASAGEVPSGCPCASSACTAR